MQLRIQRLPKIVPDFISSVYGSSCNYLFLGLVLTLLLAPSITSLYNMGHKWIKRERKKRKLCRDITWTAVQRHGQLWAYILASGYLVTGSQAYDSSIISHLPKKMNHTPVPVIIVHFTDTIGHIMPIPILPVRVQKPITILPVFRTLLSILPCYHT